ncbi:hypothetical protein QCA50_003224 [Cerrena zonata]|uniref:Uncharacterized protein n=1 Tax=Cerrena zonata TaxID=2478898 RepID=A0AAW0GVX4_9APHY
MNPGPTFLKLRTIAFSCIILINFAWVVLLFVELFLRWDISQPTQRNLVLIIAIVNALTAIMLLVLIIVKFRFWLDAGRLFFLLLAHIGPAAGFATYVAKQPCPQDGTDEESVCEMLNVYIVIASWVVPLLLIIYSLILGIVAYRHRNDSPEKEDVFEKKSKPDEESNMTPRQFTLPMMPPPASPFPYRDRRSFSSHRASTHPSTFGTSSRTTHTSRTSQMSRPTSHSQRHLSIVPTAAMPPVRQVPQPTTPTERHRSRTLSIPPIPESPPKSPGGRLSKPVPQWTWEAI